MSRDVWNRPPVGFVVEGFGEYYAYPTLVAKIVGLGATTNIPRVNARGYGNVVKNLEGHLEDLVRRSHPLRVVVTEVHPESWTRLTRQPCDACPSFKRV
jgi:hypothetical protein